jgi:hypothetical protein
MPRLLAIALAVSLASPALAARNGSGTYTLNPPAGFTSGTVISSATMNTRFSDLATEMTDSLSRTGKGGMSAPLMCVAGTVAAPGLAFTDDTDTGMFLAAAGDLRFPTGGTTRLQLNALGATVTGAVAASTIFLGSAGAVGAPAFSFTGDTNSGIYSAGADDVRLAVGGADHLKVTATETTVTKLATTGSVAVTLPAAPGSTLPMHLAASGAITAATLTRPQLPAVGQQFSSLSTGAFATASDTFVDVTNATITITTTGRPVMLFMQSDGTANPATAFATAAPGAVASGSFQFLRGATGLGEIGVGSAPAGAANAQISVPASSVMRLDTPGAGTYTYKLQARRTHADTDAVGVQYAALVAYEL